MLSSQGAIAIPIGLGTSSLMPSSNTRDVEFLEDAFIGEVQRAGGAPP
jgi:hypothetical protein